MWCDLLHYLNAKGFPELARGERLAMAGGVSARDRHPASGRAGSGVSAGGRCGGPSGCASRRSLRRRAFKRQSERCSKAATTLDLSENPGEKTLMHLLRDLTAKWGFRSGFNCKIGLQMRCSAIYVICI